MRPNWATGAVSLYMGFSGTGIQFPWDTYLVLIKDKTLIRVGWVVARKQKNKF